MSHKSNESVIYEVTQNRTHMKYLVKVQNITKEHKYNSKCQLQNKYFPFALDTTFCERQKKKLRDKIYSIC